jgi:preprotein translocase subunit SecE
MNYLRSVIQEMRNVTWLNAKQTRRDSSTVIFVSLFFAAFLGAIDWLFTEGIKYLMK